MSDDGGSILTMYINGVPLSVLTVTASLLLCAASFFMKLYGGALEEASAVLKKKSSGDDSASSKRVLKYLDDDKYIRRASGAAEMYFLCGIALSAGGFARSIYSALITSMGSSGSAAVIGLMIAGFVIGAGLLHAVFMQLPQSIGALRADKAVESCAGAFAVLGAVYLPFELVGGILSAAFAKLFGASGTTEDEKQAEAEQEILQMVGEGEENGLIEGNMKDMIENVFDFDDTKVGEIMTHRRDVVAVSDEAGISAVAEIAIKSGKSRIPVYHEDIDDICGMIHVKELLRFVGNKPSGERLPPEMIKDAVFVPESKCCSEMFEYMTSHRTQIAVVVDEFGGTGGIITMEDLVEAIVGNIQDEYDNEDEDIRQLGENVFTVDGATPPEEIAELTGLELDDGENDTIAGIILDKIGHIPKNGEHPSILIGDTRFTVQEVRDRRIAKVLIVKNRKKPDEG